jgi:hypothetical protein
VKLYLQFSNVKQGIAKRIIAIYILIIQGISVIGAHGGAVG